MRPGISDGLTTTEFQMSCTAATLSINSRNQESESLRHRVQILGEELKKARRDVANGQPLPLERAAYLNKEYPLVMAEIQRTSSTDLKLADDFCQPIRRSSPLIRSNSTRPLISRSASHEFKLENPAVIHAPTPHRPLTDVSSRTVYEYAHHERNDISYSIQEPNTRPRAVTTHPVPITSPLALPHRTGSVNNVNNLSHHFLPTAKRKQETHGHSLTYHYQQHTPLRPLVIPSFSYERPGSPFPPSPTRAADVQITYANSIGERCDSPDRSHRKDDFPFPPTRGVSPSPVSDQIRGKSSLGDYSWPIRPATPTPSSPQNLDPFESGRRSARGWHSATPQHDVKVNLHRLLLSKIQDEKVRENHGEKREFRLCDEDEVVYDRLNVVKAVQSGTGDSTGVYCEKAETQRQECNPADAGRLPSNPPSPDLSTLSKLATVLQDVDFYRQFLSFTGVDAQTILDALQLLLDTRTFPNHARNQLITAMRRLSERTDCYPSRFNLQSPVQILEDHPTKSGSYADVYKASFEGEPLCLKVIRVYESSSARHTSKVCAREVIPWGQLSHPNLLPFYGLYPFRSKIAFVSPWAENEHLGDYLEKNPCANRVLLCSDTAAGLNYLHENDIVHGDIKQANVLVDRSGRACLADFGLASVTDSQILHWATASSAASKGGSIPWQAPELHIPESDSAHTEKAVQNSKESDVFAWGCLCYEVFTGCLPFYESARESHIIIKISRGDHPTRPSSRSSPWTKRGLTPRIWGIMEDCWKFRPQERPSIVAVISQLAPLMPSDTRPPPQWHGTSAMRFRNMQSSTLAHRHPTLEDLDAILSRLL